MLKMFNKTASAVGSFGGMLADTLEGTIDIGSKVKHSIDGEISSLQYERDMENAVNRILIKAQYIKEIKDALKISATEAEELLMKEFNNGRTF